MGKEPTLIARKVYMHVVSLSVLAYLYFEYKYERKQRYCGSIDCFPY